MIDENQRHNQKMRKIKTARDKMMQSKTDEKGLIIVHTGAGKGKSSSGFGMIMRCIAHEMPCAVVQFIKGEQLSGEELYLRDQCPQVKFYQMGTGFTWNTQDRSGDIAAAEKTWAVAEEALSDEQYDLVVLDELTYMLSFKYLDKQRILSAIQNRPYEQSLVVTGRGGGSELAELADTVSEVKEIKHAYNEGVMARKGVDF